MKIGTMNHPERDVVEEIRLHADLGMEFIDLTLEPPAASSWLVDPERIRKELETHGMEVVGHTAYYLPMDSAFEEVRQGAVAELKRCLRVFSAVGAKWMNIHPGRYAPFHPRQFYIDRNIESLKELYEVGQEVGVGLMIENLPGPYNNPAQLGDLLDPLPWLGLHLDIGHANLDVPDNTTDEILDAYGDRLRHVHLHDNKGGHHDLHLPLGAGTLDIPRTLRALKRCGYDGLITLEVFTPDTHYLTYSAEVLRRLWGEG
jgi:sugar phosphate isomerase/epimerase